MTLHLSRSAFTNLAGPLAASPPAADGAARVAIASETGAIVHVYDLPRHIVLETRTSERLPARVVAAAGLLGTFVAMLRALPASGVAGAVPSPASEVA